MNTQDKNCFIVNFSKNKKVYKEEHTHQDFQELYLLVDGKMLHYINGKKQLITAPSIVFIREKDVHHIERVEDYDCCFYLIMIGINCYNHLKAYLCMPKAFDNMELLPFSPISPIQLDDLSQIEYCIKRLQKYQDKNSIMAALTQKELLLKCFSSIIQSFSIKKDVPIPLWFEDIIYHAANREVIENGVSALVRLTGKSNSYLCKYFKKYINTNPTAYINNIRIEKAAILLKTSDMDIVEVAFMVGFNNLSYFYHIFKEKYQLSPGRYRKIFKNTYF